MKRFTWIVGSVLILALLLTACGGEAELGSEDNPIEWAFVPSGETEEVTSGAEELVSLLEAETGLFFNVRITTDYSSAVEAMCAEPPEAQDRKSTRLNSSHYS